MFFSRSSTTSSTEEPTLSFSRLSLSHDDTPTSSPRSDLISSSATSFSGTPVFLIASFNEPTSSFCRLFFSHNYTPLCWSCDAAMHNANFLVVRRVCRLTCASCLAVDSDRRFSSPIAPHPLSILALCLSCHPADLSASPPPPPPLMPTIETWSLVVRLVDSSGECQGKSESCWREMDAERTQWEPESSWSRRNLQMAGFCRNVF